MTTPFPFVAGAVLTAAQMNAITELPINDKTASYTLVAGDAGQYVIMNSASATTITVNNSLFSAGQVIYVVNKGTANTVITAGAGVTIATSGSLTVPANGSGRLLALSASAFIYEASAAGGVQLITSATFTTQTSISLPNNTFTADYTNYRFLLNLSAVTADATLTMRMRASGTDDSNASYELAGTETNSSNTTVTGITSAGGLTSWSMAESDPIDRYALTVDVMAPKATEPTIIFATLTYVNTAATAWRYRNFAGCFTATTSFDSLSFISSVASSLTGSYSVYGYGK